MVTLLNFTKNKKNVSEKFEFDDIQLVIKTCQMIFKYSTQTFQKLLAIYLENSSYIFLKILYSFNPLSKSKAHF